MRFVSTFALIALTACQVDADPRPPQRPPAARPPPPRLECAPGGPARSFEGRSPALTSNAVAVLDADGGTLLHRLDAPSSAPISLPASVLAIASHGSTWLVTAPGLVGEVDATGEVLWQIALEVQAVDAAIALEGEAAWLVLRDGEDDVTVSRVDLQEHSSAPAVPIGRGPGLLLVSPGRAGLAGANNTVWTPNGAIAAPGPPIALVDDSVIFERTLATGLWIGDPPARLTRADVTPAFARVTRIGERFVVAYADGGDIFVQAADPLAGALGEPILIAADASPVAIAATGERFWVTWERGGTVEVRAGECDGG